MIMHKHTIFSQYLMLLVTVFSSYITFVGFGIYANTLFFICTTLPNII